MVASPTTTIITAFEPVSFKTTPLPIVRPLNARTSMLGPPVCGTTFGAGSVCEQVTPLHVDPLYVSVPEQLRSTALTGASAESCAAVRLLGV
jgi:hypothetical protein